MTKGSDQRHGTTSYAIDGSFMILQNFRRFLPLTPLILLLCCGPSLQVRDAPNLPNPPAMPRAPEADAHVAEAAALREVELAKTLGFTKLQDGATALLGWSVGNQNKADTLWPAMAKLLNRGVRVLDLTTITGLPVTRTRRVEAGRGESNEIQWQGTLQSLANLGQAVPARHTLELTGDITEISVPGQRVTYSVAAKELEEWSTALSAWKEQIQRYLKDLEKTADAWEQEVKKARADYEATRTFLQKVRDVFVPDEVAKVEAGFSSHTKQLRDTAARASGRAPQPEAWAKETRARVEIKEIKRFRAFAHARVGHAETGEIEALLEIKLDAASAADALAALITELTDALAPDAGKRKGR